MSNDPNLSLEGLLGAAGAAGLRRFWTALPGVVVAYDAATHTCDVQPAVLDTFETEDGERETETLPIIPDVPVAFFGGGAPLIVETLARGDSVLLLFCARSIENLKVRGADTGPIDPGDPRVGDLADAVAIPTRLDRAHVTPPTNAITFTGTEIRAGGSTPLATKADIDALAAYINTLPVGGTGSSPIPGGAPSAVGTSVLKGG